MLAEARKWIGYSRWTDPEQGTVFGRFYAQLVGSSYYGTNGVPYCAMFVSYVFNKAGATCAGLPEAYCPYILNEAKAAGKVLSDKKKAQPGDVVLFDWGGDGVCDHVGIVEKNFGSYIQTIEGNTSSGSSGSQSNGGGVYRRTRAWSSVRAVVRPSWGASSGTTTQQPATQTVKVDCYIGRDSTTAWQQQLGTPADGIISGQDASNRKYLERLTSIDWSGTSSQMVMAIQRKLNAYGGYGLKVDGYLGPKTVRAIQQWLRDACGYVRHAIDGYLGPDTAANIQNAINAGMWRTL